MPLLDFLKLTSAAEGERTRAAGGGGGGGGGDSGVTGDPHYGKVLALIDAANTTTTYTHFDRNFIDLSTNSHTMSLDTGGTGVRASSLNPYFPPEGYNSVYYSPSNIKWQTVPYDASFKFGSGDFTLECFVNITSFTTYGTFASDYNGTSDPNGAGTFFFRINNTTNQWQFQIGAGSGQSLTINSSTDLTVNTWHHIAVTRSGTSVQLWQDGVEVGSGTSSVDFNNTQTLYIGSTITQYQYTGYISNFRIVKGTAVYTSAFTTPTSPLTDITGTGLLCCQSKRYVDRSSNAHTVSPSSQDPLINSYYPSSFQLNEGNDPTKYGGSYILDSSTNYQFKTPGSVAFNYGTGDFTWEGWIRPNTLGTSYWLDHGSNGGMVQFYNGVIRYYPGGDVGTFYSSGFGSTDQISLGAWHHLAVSRVSGTTYLFLDGKLKNSGTDSKDYNQNYVVTIGEYGGNIYPFDGYMADIRITKGAGLYTADFDLPTQKLTATSQTSLLLQPDLGIVEKTGKHSQFHNYGSTSVDNLTQHLQYASTFDGTGDWIQAPSGAYKEFGSGDFTIEAWVTPRTTSTTTNYIVTAGSGTSTHYNFALQLSNKLRLWLSSNGSSWNLVTSDTTQGQGSTAVVAGQTYHVAMVRDGTNIKGYLNGNLEVTVNVSTNSVVSQSSENLNIGKSAYQGAYGYFNGDIYAVRVVKGTAVYTAAFAPPSTPLTAITNTGLLLSSSSSTVTDTSTNSHTLTVNGDTSSTREINNKETKTFDIDAAIDFKTNDYIKLGWGKGYIDGDASGTYTDTTDNNMSHNNGQIYNLQDKDFTIEFWFKRDAVTDATYADALLCNAVGIRAIAIGINPTGYTGVSYSTGTTWDGKLAADPGNTFGSIQIELGKWYHYAVVRDGSNGYQYVNGVRAETFTFSGSLSDWNGGVFLGHWHDGYSRLFNGKIAQLRFTKGVARYTGSVFNVPTSKFPENYGSASSSGTTLATDAFFANTVFLQSANTLPANTSVNDNQTYIDDSGNQTITETGTVYTSSFSPYTPDNQWSRYFNGTSSELRYSHPTGFYPPMVNFLDTNQNRTGTYELWVWLDGTQPTPSYNYTHASFMCIGGTYLNFGVLNTGALRLYFYTGAGSGTNSQNIITTTDTLSPYQWHHIALVRNGTDLRFYIDGSLSLNTTFTGVNGWASGSDGQRLTIGRGYSVVYGGEYFKGYMADIRSSSTARYTGATYTVPTDFFTSDSDTNLLINMKKMGDKSSNDWNITTHTNTTASYAKAFSPVVSSNTHVNPVSGSIRMDDASSYLEVVNGRADLQFGTGDFTAEAWIYIESYGGNGYGCIVDMRAGATATYWVLGVYNNVLDWFWGSRTGTVGTTAVRLGEWNHIAVSKSGNDLRGFLNGALEFTYDASGHNYQENSGAASPRIGRLVDASGNFVGYISDIRVVKGTGIYTSAFTPPTAPLTAVTNTQLLMNMNDYAYYDQANHLVLESSDETKANAWPWGRHIKYASYHPNSTTGYYTVAETAANEFTFTNQPVTIELFYLPVAAPSSTSFGDAVLFTTAHGTDQQGVMIAQNSGTSMHLLVGDGTWRINTTVASALTYGRWHHIAYTRQSGNIHKLYVNGTKIIEVTNTVSSTNSNNLAAIGGRVVGGYQQHPYGYIGDVRVVKGTALYTADVITPPFSSLTAVTNTTFLQSTDSTTLVDTSANPLTITQQAGIGSYTNFKTTLQVATTPLSFDGGSYINIEEGDDIIGKFGTQDFTIEAYVWRYATGIYGSWLASDHTGFNSGAIFFRFGSGSTSPSGNNNGKFHVGWHGVGDSFIQTTNTYADNTWHHYALVRSGNSFTQYVNGLRDGTATSSNEFNLDVGTGIRLGQSSWDTTNGYFNGMISQLRMTLGHARYSGAGFIIPDNYFPAKKP